MRFPRFCMSTTKDESTEKTTIKSSKDPKKKNFTTKAIDKKHFHRSDEKYSKPTKV